METILVTGSAGFIGYHTVINLLKQGYRVIGMDNINDYYDVDLKYGRLKETGIAREKIHWAEPVESNRYENYVFHRLDLQDNQGVENLFQKYKFDYVIHLAAQAGVRYSLINPYSYVDSNLKGFLNILEACRKYSPRHLLYASSSSVYGSNTKIPFSEKDNVDHPVSLYAATKKSNELMAHTYSHLYQIPTTGLRFFTVYGPWGRPDMAVFLFTKAIRDGQPIKVFNNGEMMRDFTYIDDVVEGISRLVQKPATPNSAFNSNNPDPASSDAPYRLYNIGKSGPEMLMDFISAIERALNKKAIKNMMPLQAGDVEKTWADTQELEKNISYIPQTSINEGIQEFVDWYNQFYPQ